MEGVAIMPVTLAGSGGTGGPYTFTATGLPVGLTMSPSGTISGTPTANGTFAYTVTVFDKDGNKGTTHCSVTVDAACTIPGVTISNTSWNSFRIPTGTSPVVWVHAHIGKPSGIPTTVKSTVLYTGGSLSLGGTSHALPDGLLIFDPAAPATITTTFNATANRWETLVNPQNLSDEIFFTGAAIPVTPDIAAGANATWKFTVASDAPELSFSWQWSAAVYTFWPADWNQALIEPYHAIDHAGTPLNPTVQRTLIQGPRGGGGSNYTGSWSATGTGSCPTFRTQTQGGWGAKPSGNNPGALLANNFSAVYPAGVQIGGAKTLRFTSAAAVQAFLPQGGTPAALTASAVNPTTSAAGVFAGQVLALQLSVDFSNAAITRYGLGALKVQSGKLVGYTVAQVLALANSVLGGGAVPAGLTISDINNIVDTINNNFDDGTVDRGYLK
jgi:hypothetical protein